jgi:hypothetical protein
MPLRIGKRKRLARSKGMGSGEIGGRNVREKEKKTRKQSTDTKSVFKKRQQERIEKNKQP